TKRMEKSGYRSFFYGNFSADRKRWETYPAEPRYGTQYVGLRQRVGILSESYSYAPFRDRVLASRAFVLACLEYTAENKDKLRPLLTQARDAGARPGAPVALAHKLVPLPEPVTVLGFQEEEKDGRRVATDKPLDYRVEYLGRAEATVSVSRPFA